MKPLLSIVASLGLLLTLAAAPAEAQRKASGRDDGGGGSEPARTAGGRSAGDDGGSAPRAEPSPRVSREPVSRAEPRQVQGSQPRSRVASGPAASAGSRRVADPRSGAAPQRFAAARPAGLDPRPVRIIWSPVHFPAFVGYGAWGYDPWGYRSLRYGHWYSPYAYGYWPGYFGYGYGYWEPMYGYGGGDRYDDEPPQQPGEAVGSIRFRVDPKHAAIYIDGALAGVVDDFDGLTNHLRLPAGSHTYELRAEGYRTHTGTLSVVAGQTRTERVSLGRLAAGPQ
jgi:hypothetical protein